MTLVLIRCSLVVWNRFGSSPLRESVACNHDTHSQRLTLSPHGLYTDAYKGARYCYTAATGEIRVAQQGARGGLCHASSLQQGDNAMELGLQGKHAIVTGGSRGIG